MSLIESVEDLASKGYRISIFPRYESGKWIWTAGVYIGDDTKAHWVNTSNDLPHACYESYSEAFDAVLDYCKNGKKSKK